MKSPMDACAAPGAIPATLDARKATTDSDPSTPSVAHKTYAWTPSSPAVVSLTERQPHGGLAGRLQRKRLTLVEHDSNLDARVVLTKLEPQTVANGSRSRRVGGFGAETVEADPSDTLVVDLCDASAKKNVSRGVAAASHQASKSTATINAALAKVIQRHPPSASTAR